MCMCMCVCVCVCVCLCACACNLPFPQSCVCRGRQCRKAKKKKCVEEVSVVEQKEKVCVEPVSVVKETNLLQKGIYLLKKRSTYLPNSKSMISASSVVKKVEEGQKKSTDITNAIY
jgi:hypothetical protein